MKAASKAAALSRRELCEAEAADRGTGLVVVVLLHAAVIAALLQIGAVRQALRETAPLFVSFIAPEQPKAEPEPPAPPPPRARPPTPSRLITSERPTAAPSEFTAPPTPVDDAPSTPGPVEAPVVAAAPAPAAAAPRVVTSVQYVRAPRVEYPMASRRLGEHGRVVVRVLIDRSGNAERVELQQASRYPRLNEAALKAAQEALYRPYTENGEAHVVWALVPVLFELN